MLISSIHHSLNELIDLLQKLTNEEYAKPCEQLSCASIGEHTRHIIEMFQCLQKQYFSGKINYDRRDRNIQIQTETAYAIAQINEVKAALEKENIKLQLIQIVHGQELSIESNYERELLYNLEHCVHHQALIKVAVLISNTITVDENFGVARSTIEYRNQCAQ